ncbi:MAG: rhodanese-like domain-containing protein [Rhodothermaceae bacterium]|nr:rhodanese-like domain-containing protein [Rhodothermaceae bacterium]
MRRFFLPAAAVLVIVLIAALLFFFRGGSTTLTPETFVAGHEPDALILDVRTPEEYAAGHLDGAVNINLFADDFAERVDAFDRDRPVYLYCGSGQRSGRAARLMEEMGFEEPVNVGGYGALKAAGADVVEP